MDLSVFYLPTWREGYGLSLGQYYEELTESAKLADRLGYRRVMTTEHHFHYYGGAVPNPAVLLSAWARETSQVRLCASVSLMQLRHPLQVAEDYALVDQLSGGRFDMGVARGFVPHEFAAFGIPQAEAAERIAEGLSICRQFWAGQPFAHHGKHFSFDMVQPWPPAVAAKVPIWNAASNTRESFVNAAERGYHLMMNQYPMSFEALAEKFGWYCSAWEAAGHARARRQAMVALMTHLGDTEEQAIAEAKRPLQEHVNAFTNVMRARQWDTDYEGDERVFDSVSDNADWRDVIRQRTLIGTPQQAAERIRRYRQLGFSEISLIARFAGISHAQSMRTIRRMHDEVMPLLGARVVDPHTEPERRP